MKRVFYFVLSVLTLVAGASAAQAEIKLTTGGTINFQAADSEQKSEYEAGIRDYGFRNDTEVSINAESEMDGGMKYGASIELEADVTADARGEGLNADKTYLWLEGAPGRFELGNNAGVEQTMVINAASIARATGGIDGDDEFYFSAGLALIHPDLPSADVGGIAEDATKISYYSPVWSGFQIGVNYTPDEGDGGQSPTRGKTDGDYDNVFGLASLIRMNTTTASASAPPSSARSVTRRPPCQGCRRKTYVPGRPDSPSVTKISPSQVLMAIGAIAALIQVVRVTRILLSGRWVLLMEKRNTASAQRI